MYVIRPEYLTMALEKCADPQEALALEALTGAVSSTDQLECKYPMKLREARSSASIRQPDISQAAQDEIDTAAQTGKHLDRILARRCRRTATAAEVIRLLIEPARDDLELAEFLASGAEDRPALELASALTESKRTVVAQLEEFLVRFG